MQAEEYSREVMRTVGTQDRRDQLVLGGLGLGGEAGEVIDHIKKAIFQGHRLDADHLAEELGDVLWYVTVLAHTQGFSLGDVMERNVEKLRRRYPNGFESGRSMNR